MQFKWAVTVITIPTECFPTNTKHTLITLFSSAIIIWFNEGHKLLTYISFICNHTYFLFINIQKIFLKTKSV